MTSVSADTEKSNLPYFSYLYLLILCVFTSSIYVSFTCGNVWNASKYDRLKCSTEVAQHWSSERGGEREGGSAVAVAAAAAAAAWWVTEATNCASGVRRGGYQDIRSTRVFSAHRLLRAGQSHRRFQRDSAGTKRADRPLRGGQRGGAFLSHLPARSFVSPTVCISAVYPAFHVHAPLVLAFQTKCTSSARDLLRRS